jgi:hypothetical protein
MFNLKVMSFICALVVLILVAIQLNESRQFSIFELTTLQVKIVFPNIKKQMDASWTIC